MDAARVPEKRLTVAVVGTGMAGLVTAWLLNNDPQRRYDVKIFENGTQTSLDSASITVADPSSKKNDRIDVPMRAFTEGYYHNLKAMYDSLAIRYRVQPFLFSFARFSEHREEAYFIHASNNHQIPPRKPMGMNIVAYLFELSFVLICHIWFNIACLWMPARASPGALCESFDQYLRRIRLPQYFVKYYLLPLMSAVTTCTHQELLRFPAKDVVDYKRCITSGRQLVVTGGVSKVQQKLLKGLEVSYSANVKSVEPRPAGVILRWNDQAAKEAREELFDKVILAVPPNVVGSIFPTVHKEMSMFPTTSVQTIVHRDNSSVPQLHWLQASRPLINLGDHDAKTQVIHLRTSTRVDVSTEATHVQASGAMVTSCPVQSISKSSIIGSATFTRVLRTPESRNIVNRIFDLESVSGSDVKDSRWRNGDDGVYLTGAWCWDGMVLLEGCVVSAMRIARAFDVEVPWARTLQATTSPLIR